MNKPEQIKRLTVLASMAILMTGVQLVNSLSGYALLSWGLWPRHLSGLPGILLAPWLHGSWSHLWTNLPVLLILSALTMWTSISRFLLVSGLIITGGGLLVWLFGRDSMHVGASGWVFGLWAWLMMLGFFQRKIINILIALFVLLYYGGLWWGMLPQTGVSVESHIAGALIGGFLAYLTRQPDHRI